MPGFHDLLEQAAGVSLEKQLAFADLLNETLGEEHDWQLSLDSGIISFGNALGERISAPFQLLGSFSMTSFTWLWAWADERNDFSFAFLDAAQQVQAFGEAHAIPELCVPQSSVLPSEDIAHALALVATDICHLDLYYRCPHEYGVTFIGFDLGMLRQAPAPDTQRVISICTTLTSLPIESHRRAILAYACRKSWEVTSQASALDLTLSNGSIVTLDFDELDRVISIAGRL